MDLATFLERVRNHYLEQFQQFTHAQQQCFDRGATEVKLRLAPESALFGKLYCVDFIGDSGQGHSVQELVPDDGLDFDRVSLKVGMAYVALQSMSWDDAVVEHDADTLSDDTLQPWFERWFDPESTRRLPGAPHADAIHSLLVAPNRLSVDLGTAPVDAFLDLLEILERAGARSMTVHDSRSAEA